MNNFLDRLSSWWNLLVFTGMLLAIVVNAQLCKTRYQQKEMA